MKKHAPPTATPMIPPVPSTLEVEEVAGDADGVTSAGMVVTVVPVTVVV